MNLTLRFRAYPSAEVASEAWRHIELHRQIRNHAVCDYYSYPKGSRPTRNQQVNELPGWKRLWPVFSMVSAHAAQQTVRQIHTDVDNLGKKAAKGYKTGRLKWQGAGEFRSVGFLSACLQGVRGLFSGVALSSLCAVRTGIGRDVVASDGANRAATEERIRSGGDV